MGQMVNSCLIDSYVMYDFYDFLFCQKGCYLLIASQFDRSTKIVISEKSGVGSPESGASPDSV